MKYIECPDTFDPYHDFSLLRVFMAGGITNCPDWQLEARQMLLNDPNIMLINPRRSNFDVTIKTMTTEQIKWEFEHLKSADAVMFWFPKETLCPITLFELGVQSMIPERNIFVGCHPEYQRKLDVEVQLSLSRPEIIVRDSLSDVIGDITNWIDNNLIS